MGSRQRRAKVTFRAAKEMPPMAVSFYDTSYNKTGVWRYVRPVIDLEKCIYCTNCWKFCPEPAISLQTIRLNGKEKPEPVINYDFCKGCGICAQECPVDAIRLERECR